MGTIITDADVRHVAKLSRLKLSDERVHYFAAQLTNVMGYIAKLNELNVDGVEPMAHPTDITNAFRDDTPGRPMSVEAALANAPDADSPFFRVPKVLGDGGGS